MCARDRSHHKLFRNRILETVFTVTYNTVTMTGFHKYHRDLIVYFYFTKARLLNDTKIPIRGDGETQSLRTRPFPVTVVMDGTSQHCD